MKEDQTKNNNLEEEKDTEEEDFSAEWKKEGVEEDVDEIEKDEGEENEEEGEEDNNKTKEKRTPVEITFQEEKSWMKKEGELAVDVYETENSIVIQAPVAGVKKEDVEVFTEKDVVIIKGKRERCESKEIKGFYSKECFFGNFRREIILPEETDLSSIDANIKEGVLRIEIPKKEREGTKKVEI